MSRVESGYFPTDCTTFSNLRNVDLNTEFMNTALLLPDDILNAVSDEFGVPLEALTGKRTLKPIREARGAAYYFLHHRGHRTLEKTAKLTGREDHTTVISGLKRVELLISTRADFREHIDNLRSRFNGMRKDN